MALNMRKHYLLNVDDDPEGSDEDAGDGKDGVFLGMAGLLLGIYFGLRPREILQSSTASPQRTLSVLPLLLGLTQPFLPQPNHIRALSM